MDKQTWDKIINEGGEGYNPFDSTDNSGEPEWSKVEEMWAKTQRILNCTSPSDSMYPRLVEQEATLKATYKHLQSINK